MARELFFFSPGMRRSKSLFRLFQHQGSDELDEIKPLSRQKALQKAPKGAERAPKGGKTVSVFLSLATTRKTIARRRSGNCQVVLLLLARLAFSSRLEREQEINAQELAETEAGERKCASGKKVHAQRVLKKKTNAGRKFGALRRRRRKSVAAPVGLRSQSPSRLLLLWHHRKISRQVSSLPDPPSGLDQHLPCQQQ